MAQLNITLNQEEILQLISGDRDGAFKKLLQESLNSILKAESQEQLKASPYERTEERTDSRNGVRTRELVTRIGKIELAVPRYRNQPFKTCIFENYSRSEAALITSMAEMVVNGVSTRKVSRVVEAICGESISKSAVSEICKELDDPINEFRNRPLHDTYPFLMLDATYFKVREDHRIVSKAFMIAYATTASGQRTIIGFESHQNESKETWTDFIRGLKKRGLKDVQIITSDAHEGLLHAIRKEFPSTPWQRCQFHFVRNILDKAPKKMQAGLSTELTEMFNSKSLKQAREKCREIVDDYLPVAETAMECLEEGFESAMTVMILPTYLQTHYRTSNPIERINRELKRRSNVIGVFHNEASLIRLMGAVLMEEDRIQSARRRMFGDETYAKMQEPTVVQKLISIAQEQGALLAA